MPEPLIAHNSNVSPAVSGSLTDSEDDAFATIEFLPPLVSRTLITAWILLFSGRWLIVQGMVAAGLFGLDPTDKIESIDKSLGRCYALLFSITMVTLAVRIIGSLKPVKGQPSSETDFNAQRGPISADAGTVEAEAPDRGGKKA